MSVLAPLWLTPLPLRQRSQLPLKILAWEDVNHLQRLLLQLKQDAVIANFRPVEITMAFDPLHMVEGSTLASSQLTAKSHGSGCDLLWHTFDAFGESRREKRNSDRMLDLLFVFNRHILLLDDPRGVGDLARRFSKGHSLTVTTYSHMDVGPKLNAGC